VPTCRIDTSLGEAVGRLLGEHLEALIVLDERGDAVGALTRQDIVAAYGRPGADLHNEKTLTIAEVMRHEIPEVPPDIPAITAAQIMLDLKVRELYLMHHDCGIRWPAAAFRFEDVCNTWLASQKQIKQAVSSKELFGWWSVVGC
jgi:CBS-domain-containing membrane protein